MKKQGIEKAHRLTVVVFFGAYLLTYGYSLMATREGATGNVRVDLIASAFFLAIGGLAHACYLLGWRRALAFAGLSIGLSAIAETMFLRVLHDGNLVYTNVLGPTLPGGVPMVIPLWWFMMTYPAYLMANLILDGRLTWTWCKTWRIVWLSFITAVIHTAWDLSRNPTMSTKVKAWVWQTTDGEYFDVPYVNYWGWVLLTFAIVLLYRLLERRIKLEPMGPVSVWVGLPPVLIYALSGIADIVGGGPEPVRLIVPFAMGIPVYLALNRMFGKDRPDNAEERLWGEAAD